MCMHPVVFPQCLPLEKSHNLVHWQHEEIKLVQISTNYSNLTAHPLQGIEPIEHVL